MAAARAPAAQAARRLLETPGNPSPTLAYMNARSAQAIRQRTRRRAREEATALHLDNQDIRQRQIAQHRELAKLRKHERHRRRIDWELGALAPAWHLMDNRGPALHGSLPFELANSVKVLAAQRKDWGIEEGDRVVIVQPGYRDTGKIGKVDSVRYDEQTVSIGRLNLANVEYPEQFATQEADKTPFRPLPLQIPLAHVRLVVPLFNADADGVRDSIIDAVRVKPAHVRRGQSVPKRRFVAGVHPPLEIPYAAPAEAAEHDGDTLRIEVEEHSWTPTLSEPPMPPSILNELRNPYSKFRTRHDAAWVAARDAEHFAAATDEAVRAATMITPLEERRLARAAEAEPLPDLDDKTLEGIGRLMAKNLKLEGVVMDSEEATQGEQR